MHLLFKARKRPETLKNCVKYMYLMCMLGIVLLRLSYFNLVQVHQYLIFTDIYLLQKQRDKKKKCYLENQTFNRSYLNAPIKKKKLYAGIYFCINKETFNSTFFF